MIYFILLVIFFTIYGKKFFTAFSAVKIKNRQAINFGGLAVIQSLRIRLEDP